MCIMPMPARSYHTGRTRLAKPNSVPCSYCADFQWVVKHSNLIALVIAAEVIKMSVRVDNHNGFVSGSF
jgi:hypothetical protein